MGRLGGALAWILPAAALLLFLVVVGTQAAMYVRMGRIFSEMHALNQQVKVVLLKK